MAKAIAGDFSKDAEKILSLKIKNKVSSLGGYGDNGEVVYESHPSACPSVLVDNKKDATLTYMSNGSVDFLVKNSDGFEINVLDGHFDAVEKREIGVPSTNLWFSLDGSKKRIASLMNPSNNIDLKPSSIKIVKLGDPNRSMWYCAEFKPSPGICFQTAIKLSMAYTPKGPALLREVYIKNCGKKAIKGNLWAYMNLHGTQKFNYNKHIWYDAGLPVSNTETLMTATVPYSNLVQIKRLSSEVGSNIKALDATCDYTSFIGDTSVMAIMPSAVLEGDFIKGGAGKKLNRFATAGIAANKFSVNLNAGKSSTIRQSLLYVTEAKTIEKFRKDAGSPLPDYREISKSFIKASKTLIKATADVNTVSAMASVATKAVIAPDFNLTLPTQQVAAEYANSAWTTVKELYENCRAHGETLADGIELGTRDRGQDMWPKLKEDPARIREDLVYTMGFMYWTSDNAITNDKRLTIVDKLHGMFPRQFPSKWNNRKMKLMNDNRPYTDSPLWLVDSICMYIKETGDFSLLLEDVTTIKLTDPETPEKSGIIGNNKTLKMVEVVAEIFAAFERHSIDSPYGTVQILYGEWCDPIDMYGTSKVGDDQTRGKGRGTQIRLSAHVFSTIVDTIDVLSQSQIQDAIKANNLNIDVKKMQEFADLLRQNIVKVAWEKGLKGVSSGFLNVIHELKKDGSAPNYKKGEIGYTLGSMNGLDYDGIKRRELGTLSYCLNMLNLDRTYLSKIENTDSMIKDMLASVDKDFYDPKLGLVMFTTPMANNQKTIDYVGRMGILPAGTAENGEYHHCQVFMHRNRLAVPNQADKVWKQFMPLLSAMRDETLGGPFETPATSYVSDKNDPHFGQGMYFGLSGSIDWLVEIFIKIAGVEFNLHNDSIADVSIKPNLPKELDYTLTFKRIIHVWTGKSYRKVPLTLDIKKDGNGKKLKEITYKVNGKKADAPELSKIGNAKKVDIDITYNF